VNIFHSLALLKLIEKFNYYFLEIKTSVYRFSH